MAKRIYEEWLINWLSKGEEIGTVDFADKNFFELGLIDSFGVIELIDEIETKFAIKFSQDHFEQRRFATISGLAKIIEELKEV